MSYYDSYVEKIKQIAKVKNTVLKYRVPIIITASLIVASITGFLLSKGTITQNVSLPTEMVYGEDINITEAEALFAETEYEYCLKGTSSWTKKKPRMPGDYLVRVVSIGGFGEEKYGEPVEFTILPKESEITIRDNSVVYGSDPKNIGIDLAFNDKITNIDFIYEDITKDSTDVKVDLNTLVILSDEGEDVTSFYALSTESKSLSISKKSISLIPDISSKVYDGLQVSYSDDLTSSSLESLANNDDISFKSIIKDSSGNVLSSLPKDAGKYTCEIDPESVKVVNGSSDRTNKYSLNLVKVNFEITQREINVYTGSSIKDYDGLILQNTSIEDCGISSNSPYALLSGDYLVLDESKYISSITNVGKVSNEFTVSVFNKDNKDITSNYKITYSYGTLEVKPLELIFEALYISNKVYDGNYVSYESSYSNYASVDKKIPSSEEIRLNITFESVNGTSTSVKDSAVYSYILTSFDVKNGNKDNYKVSIKDASFEISKRSVSIRPYEISNKEYDGKEIVYPSYVNNFEIVSSSLVSGESFIVELGYTNSNKEIVSTPIDASSYIASIANIKPQGSTSLANYDFTYLTEEFEISKKNIVIKPSVSYLDNSYYYDGLVHNYDYLQDYNYIETNGYVLPNFEKIRISGVSYYYKNGNSLVLSSLKNAGTYVIKIDSHTFNDFVNSNNYQVSYEDAEVTIYPREVIISPTNFSNKDYDGIPYTYEVTMGNFTYPSYVGSSNKLVEGENISINAIFEGDSQGEVLEAVNVDNYMVSIIANSIKGDSNTLLSNYNFSYDSVYFTISKRSVTISPNVNYIYGDSIYDGTIREYDYTNNNYTLINNSFVTNEDIYISKVEFYVDSMLVNSVKDANVYEVRIVDIAKVGSIDLDNYNIITTPVNYEISKRNVSIAPKNFEDKVYDGVYYEYLITSGNFVYNSNSLNLVNGEEIVIYPNITGIKYQTNGYSVKDADTYTISISYVSAYNNINLNNYNFDISSTVSFTISRRNVTLKPIQIDDYVYDGNYYYYPYNEGNFLYASSTMYNLVGQENLIVDTKITSSSGEEIVPHDVDTYTISILGVNLVPVNGLILDNYIFTYETETFSILVREVHISLDVLNNKDYDGVYYNYDQVTYTYSSTSPYTIANNEYMDIHVSFNGVKENVKDAKTYLVELNDYFINDGSINKDNYLIISSTFEFTIYPRHVVLKPINFENKVYDGESYVYEDYFGNYQTLENTLVPGELVKVSVISTSLMGYTDIKNADTYTLYIDENSVIPSDGTLLSNYRFDFESCSFVISKRDITMSPINFDDKDYDGIAYVYKQEMGNFVDVNSTLVEGENFQISVNIISEKGYTDIKNADTYTLVLTEENITPSEDTLMSNYQFTCIPVSFTIHPRKVTLTPLQIGSREYNGVDELLIYPSSMGNFAYPEGTLEENKLVEGENIQIEISVREQTLGEVTSIKNVGVYTMSVVLNSWIPDSNTLIENYHFTTQDHRVVISPRDVYISVSEEHIIGSPIYDGTTLGYRYEPNNYKYASNTPFEMVEGEGVFLQISLVSFYLDGRYVTEAKNVGEYTIKIESVISLNEEVLLLSNYNIETQYGDKKFRIDPRPITISPFNFANKVYDGIAYQYEIYGNNFILEEGSIVEGEEISIDVYYLGEILGKVYTPIDADTYVIKIGSVYEYNSGTLTSNYDISYSQNEVKFTISQRTVYISLEEYISKVYDGKYYSNVNVNYDVLDKIHASEKFENVEEAYSLVEGHYLQLVIKFNDIIDKVKDANTYVVTLESYSVNDGDILHSNYIIISNSYTFEITKLTIEIKPYQLLLEQGGTKVYDGDYVYYPSGYGNFDYVSENRFLDNDNVSIEVSMNDSNASYVKDVGEYNVNIVLINPTDESVKVNYDIKTNHTTSFSITRRSVTIIPQSLPNDYVYIREEVIYSSYYPNGSYKYPENTEDINKFVYDEGVTISVMFSDGQIDEDGNYINLTESVINAGSYKLVITSYQAYENTNLDNYDLDVYGTTDFTISPREITLVPGGVGSKTYDGIAYDFTIKEGNYSVTSGSIIPGEGFTIRDVTYTDVLGNVLTDGAVNAGRYHVYVDKETIEPNSNTLLSNYIIYINDYSEFEIERRTVSLKLDTKYIISTGNGVYDGNMYTYDCNVSENYIDLGTPFKLVEDEKVRITKVFFNDEESAIDAGSYVLTSNEIYVEGVGDTLVTNYIFNIIQSEYTIKTRTVYIILSFLDVLENNTKIYDGKYVSIDSVTYKLAYINDSYDLIEGHNLQLTILFNGLLDEVRYAGNYDVLLVEWKVLDSEGKEIKHSNYDIKENNLSFSITPRDITIKPIDIDNDKPFTYDGNKITYPTGESGSNYFDVIDGQLMEDENGNKDQFYISVYFDNVNTEEKETASYAIDAGSYVIEIASIYGITSTDEEAKQLVDSYNFTREVSDEFTINRKTVHIYLDRIEEYQVYDNITYSTLTHGFNIPNEVVIDDKTVDNRLVDGHTLSIVVSYNNKLEDVKDVGTYFVELSSYSVNSDDGLINPNNYLIISDSYEFTIDKRVVNIYPIFDNLTSIDSDTYSGKEYNYIKGYNNFLSKEGMAKDEYLEVVVEFNGQMAINKNLLSPINADEYIVTIINYLVSEGVDIETNYSINLYEGTYTIDPRKITLVPGGVGSKTYDGIAYDFTIKEGNYEVTSGSIVEGEGFTITDVIYVDENDQILTDGVVNAGKYKVYINKDTIIPNENTLMSNYEISIETEESIEGSDYILFEIYKRGIYIKANAEDVLGAKYYDGNGRSYSKKVNNFAYYKIDNVKYFNLVDYEYLTIEVDFYSKGEIIDPSLVVNAGSYIMQVDKTSLVFSCKDGTRTSEEIKSNYEVFIYDENSENYNAKEITYSIAKRKVTISTLDVYGDFIYKNEQNEDYPDYFGNFTVVESEDSYDFVEGEGLKIYVYFYNTNTSVYSDYALDAATYNVYIQHHVFSENTLEINYDIRIDYNNVKSFTIHKRGISVDLYQVDSTNIVYKNDSYYPYPDNQSKETVLTMPNGESLQVKVYYYDKNGIVEHPTDAGTYYYISNIYNMKISRSKGSLTETYSADKNYYIIENGIKEREFVINRAPITVDAVDSTYTYDGQAFNYLDSSHKGDYVLVEGKLYDEHALFKLDVKYVKNGVEVIPIDADTYEQYGFLLSGSRVSNYDVTYVTSTLSPSKLTISPRNVTIGFTGETTKVYTGEAYDFSTLEILQTNFIGNDRVIVTQISYLDSMKNPLTGPAIDAGTYTANIETYEFVEGKSSNYNVTMVNSQIVIRPCEVTILPYEFEGFDYGEGQNEYERGYENYHSIKFEVEHLSYIVFDLAVDFINTSISNKSYDIATEAGRYILQVDKLNTLIKYDLDKVSNFNFNIDPSYNNTSKNPSFVISARSITVYTGDATFTYDGLEHKYTEGHCIDEKSKYTLVEGHQFVPYIEELDETQFTFVDVKRDELGNVVAYENKIPASIVYIDGNGKLFNMSHNYTMNYAYGKVTIKPVDLYVSTGSATFVYDPNGINVSKFDEIDVDLFVLTNSEDLVTVKNITDKITARFDLSKPIKNVGTYENKLVYTISGSRGDVTKNYEIHETTGTITVIKAVVDLEFEELTREFSKQIYTYNGSITATTNYDKVWSGNKFSIKYEIRDEDGNVYTQIRLAKNYHLYITDILFNNKSIINDLNIDLTYPDYIKYNVTKPVIDVYTGSANFVFNSSEHCYGHVWMYASKPENEYLIYDVGISAPSEEELPKVKYPGEEVENKFEPVFTVPEEEYMDNFQFVYHYGTLSITDKLTVTYLYDDLYYNGEKRAYGEALTFYDVSLPGVNVVVTDYQLMCMDELGYWMNVDYILDAGQYTLAPGYTYHIYYNDEDYTEYFNFTNKDEIMINIDKVEICLGLKDYPSIYYDGKEKTITEDDGEIFLFYDYSTKKYWKQNYQFPDNHIIKVSGDNSIKDAGAVYVGISSYCIYNQYGEDVTYNFMVYTSAYQIKSDPNDREIQEFQSRINIKPRNIMIKSYGAKMEYMEKNDGYLWNNKYEYVPQHEEGWDLLEGYTMELEYEKNKPYSFAIDRATIRKNELKFIIKDETGKVVEGGFRIKYLTHDDMYLEITKKQIIIYTGSASGEYVLGGNVEVTCKDYVVEGLVDGHVLDKASMELAITGSLNYMGNEATNGIAQVKNTLDVSKVVIIDQNNGNARVTTNYEIIVVEGTLTMYPPNYSLG